MIFSALDDLHEREVGLLVSYDEDRVESMLAAIRGGYVTHVVTAESTAESLLEQSPGNQSA